MATEIEHKFLVVDDSYKSLASDKSEITQGFLSRDPQRVVRVRVRDDKGFITIKGATVAAARPEFEYQIPLDDAMQLMALCEPPVIVKTRYIVEHQGEKWEVDEFHGDLQPLVIAELEVPYEGYDFELPPFVGREVTDDPRYYNSNLSAPL